MHALSLLPELVLPPQGNHESRHMTSQNRYTSNVECMGKYPERVKVACFVRYPSLRSWKSCRSLSPELHTPDDTRTFYRFLEPRSRPGLMYGILCSGPTENLWPRRLFCQSCHYWQPRGRSLQEAAQRSSETRHRSQFD
ncbi:hypothetical protein BJV78DRAFT_1244363 [Lactifluus subvellereus]|nr:hypothetical protein BJV78DRAFT_1244363 [Lactifluus subvellereus]